MSFDITRLFARLSLLIVAGCTSGPPVLPYPAFIDVNGLDNAFIAGLPGVRSKQLAGDPDSRSISSRVQLPSDWQFTTGASPAHSVEIFVLAGEVGLGEFVLAAGGYAYIPPGSSGFQMRSDNGALILYFLDDANDNAVIQTPLIASSELLGWQPAGIGYSTKELRADPGSGARTWLLKVEPKAVKGWQRSTQTLEGYLLSGVITESECDGDEAITADYKSNSYFYRPPGAISGGPKFASPEGAVWFLKIRAAETIESVAGCTALAP